MSFTLRKDTLNIVDGAYRFDPNQIEGLVAHFDFSDITTITKSQSNQVFSVTETKFGGSNILTQSSSGAQPVLSDTGLNGKTALTFNGFQYLTLSNTITLPTSYIIFTVVSTSVSSINQDYFLANSLNEALLGHDNGGFAVRGRDGGTLDSSSANWYVGSNPVCTIFRRFLDNSVTTQIDLTTQLIRFSPNFIQSGNLTLKHIGGRTTGNRWNGAIGEIVIYDSSVSSGSVSQVQSYLRTKWAISI